MNTMQISNDDLAWVIYVLFGMGLAIELVSHTKPIQIIVEFFFTVFFWPILISFSAGKLVAKLFLKLERILDK